jgi:hypothetical protein
MTVKLYGHYNICSSPLRGDHENSETQKKVWIQKHLKPAPVDIIITPNKAKFAKQADGTPNILVDDRGSNISAWEAAVGIGIKYQADEDGLDVIVDGFARARKIMKGEEEHKPQALKSLDRSNGKLIAKSGDSDEHPTSAADVKESASSGATGSGSIASAPAQGGGWLFGGTVGAPTATKKKKSKIIKRTS